MTASATYTYTWDVDKNDNKVESGKFVIFPRYNWGGYRMKDKCYDRLKKEVSDDIDP